MYCPGSKINLWCRAQVKKENDGKWSIQKMRYAIFQQLREKHPKMDAPNYVCGLSIKQYYSVTKSYVPQNTVLHQLASNWLSKPIITKAVMIHHKSH